MQPSISSARQADRCCCWVLRSNLSADSEFKIRISQIIRYKARERQVNNEPRAISGWTQSGSGFDVCVWNNVDDVLSCISSQDTYPNHTLGSFSFQLVAAIETHRSLRTNCIIRLQRIQSSASENVFRQQNSAARHVDAIKLQMQTQKHNINSNQNE